MLRILPMVAIFICSHSFAHTSIHIHVVPPVIPVIPVQLPRFEWDNSIYESSLKPPATLNEPFGWVCGTVDLAPLPERIADLKYVRTFRYHMRALLGLNPYQKFYVLTLR